FDRQVVMDLPDINGRRKILDVHIAKIRIGKGIDLDVIARTTPGFSGADLANLCNEAALLAARSGKEVVTQAELEEARDKVSYGRERRSRRITERERRLTAYHEAGHALVALHNEYCTPVHKVTIIPRGRAYLGATFTMPKEDVYTKTCLELLAEMAMCMGGRAAEEIIFGDITTGASADIQHMTAIAKHMVCIYGMAEGIGPTKVGDFSNHPHLRIDGPPADMPSPETQREIDLEVRRLVNEALESARTCLKEHADELKLLAEELLKKETLDISEIDVLLGRTAAAPVAAVEPAIDGKPEETAGNTPVEPETDTPGTSENA
ncbi:MAG: ATP-dependent metallopeptidase FtsH/Yme1/Tma family protein, partial [Victivallaceae bacterium]|nr:ATP-dependent metallopeptidase FtsH/Yme1/Tma family protein [Victivallaceae bacterium]